MNLLRQIALSILVPLVVLSALQAVDACASEERPNILLLIADDQRYDTMSSVQAEQGEAGRFPWTETPNMDRLAGEGVRFRNAFVVTSLSSPSRATILTGTYGHINGIVNNRDFFPLNSDTYPKLLQEAGYRTGYFGKWLMGRQSGPRPGFDVSASFIGQGLYFDEPFEVNGEKVASQGWVDDVTTDYALEFLREAGESGLPFAMTVGFKAPHGPFEPPQRLADFYAGKKSRPAPNLGIPLIFDPDKKPENFENLDYHRTIHGIDENLGRILDELDKLGLAENTLVIYTSGNGLFRGEHSLGDKRAAYEESMRVPMLFRYPKLGLPPEVLDQIVLNIDIPPTILDYAGVKIPDSMQGRSWKPLLAGTATDWRTSFFYCYHREREFPRVPTTTAVRTESAKLIKYPDHPDWTELFDLAADPHEMRNLLNDLSAQELKTRLEELLDRESEAVGFRIPEAAD
jgi:arylsulfatase A-like enzyme